MKFSLKLKNQTSQYSLLEFVYSPVLELLETRSFDPVGQTKIDHLKETMKYGWRWVLRSEHSNKLPLYKVQNFFQKYYPTTEDELEFCSELEYIGRAYVVLETSLCASYILDRLSPMKYDINYFEDLSELIPTFFVLKSRLDVMKLSEKDEKEIFLGTEKMYSDLMMAHRLTHISSRYNTTNGSLQ